MIIAKTQIVSTHVEPHVKAVLRLPADRETLSCGVCSTLPTVVVPLAGAGGTSIKHALLTTANCCLKLQRSSQNISPFMTTDVLGHDKKSKLNITWDKVRAMDFESAPWFKIFGGDSIDDHHPTRADKEAARAKAGGS